jgi:hypothetical protein
LKGAKCRTPAMVERTLKCGSLFGLEVAPRMIGGHVRFVK